MASNLTVRSIEDNMGAFWHSYGSAPRVKSGDANGIIWLATGIQHPLFNGVPMARFSGNDPDSSIDDVLSELRAANAPSMWWLGPSALPADIRERLTSRGLNHVGTVPGMAAELSDINTEAAPQGPLKIELAEDAEARRLWGRVAGIGTGVSSDIADQFGELEAGMAGIDNGHQFRFTGFENGEAVAVSALFLNSGVAGIYAVATLPRARRKGYGNALTFAALAVAKKNLYEVAILQASDMGHPLYSKLGFRDVCQFELFA